MTRKMILVLAVSVLGAAHAHARTLFLDTFATWPEPARWSLQTANADAWQAAWGKMPHKDGYAGFISGNQELQDYVAGNPDAFTADGTGLHIRATTLSSVQRAAAEAAGNPAKSPYLSFQSGIMTTHDRQSFQATPGHPLVVRALVSAGSAKGLWPALWLLPQSGAWPPEMDIMEIMPATHPRQIHCGIISAHGNAGDWYALPNKGTWKGGAQHKVAFILDADRKVAECVADGFTLATFDVSGRPDLFTAFYLLANVAVGGNWVCNDLGSGRINDKSLPRLAGCADAIAADYAVTSENTGMTIRKLTVDDNLAENAW